MRIVIAAAAVALAACVGTSRHKTYTHAGGGLRTVSGYRDYEGCRARCSGTVPAALRRPLRLRRLAAREACPITRAHADAEDFSKLAGEGPVYAAITSTRGNVHVPFPLPPRGSGQPFAGSAWSGFKVLWVSRPSYEGPVLIRGRRLDGPGALGFGVETMPWDEMQFPRGDEDAAPRSRHGGRNWPSISRVLVPGCYGWQVDGAGFSGVIVVKAVA